VNFYKRHIGDYLKDTAHLSLLEHGVYTRLLDVYYTRESGIPDAQAARLISARTKEECAALKLVLEEFFDLVDETWIQHRCEREIDDASAQAKANRENGKKGGRPKAKHNPTDNPNETDQKPNGFSLGSISETEKNLSQTPDSRLQTPEVKNKGARAALELPDWLPEDAWEAFVDMRKKLKAPLTERAAKLALGELEKLSAKGHAPREVLEQSVLHSWRGLFEVKKKSSDKTSDRCNPDDMRYVN
jgi:uncharacterized protein YdaU (DUF1376 family)